MVCCSFIANLAFALFSLHNILHDYSIQMRVTAIAFVLTMLFLWNLKNHR